MYFLWQDPQVQKKGFKVWNNQILEFFTVFTKGTQEKLIELESESNIFTQKRKNYHWHLPITTSA